jgi:uncharacterized protein (TIGR02147 family)
MNKGSKSQNTPINKETRANKANKSPVAKAGTPAPTPGVTPPTTPEVFPDVYNYFSYRDFLKAAYQARKAVFAGFSYRYIGQKAGFSSAGFFSKVLNGQSNISQSMAIRIGEVFRLKRHELDYFQMLVQYDQATQHEEKRTWFSKLIEKRRSRVRNLEKEQFMLFDNWYYVAIRELLDFYIFTGDDYTKLGKMLEPAITATQAKQAIDTLVALGLVRQNEDGHFERVEALVSTGEAWQSLAITSFQQNMIEMARSSIDRISRKHRDVSTLTVSVSESSVQHIQDILRNSRRQILEVAKSDQFADRVMQLNFQCFPLSKIEESHE